MVRIRLSADVQNLEQFLSGIRDTAARHDFPEKRIREIELAAEEALVNIFQHAYPEGDAGDVLMECSLDPGGEQLIIRFLDTGIAFDNAAIAEPDLTLDLEERPVGGLGFFFMQTMVDEVTSTREGETNILTLTAGRTRKD
ncbi:MAG: ATP-binding protein [Desulfohalobiaceae bacterium]|nr:ATP-binding protein [Desulfohalobiaceae bacterium]